MRGRRPAPPGTRSLRGIKPGPIHLGSRSGGRGEPRWIRFFQSTVVRIGVNGYKKVRHRQVSVRSKRKNKSSSGGGPRLRVTLRPASLTRGQVPSPPGCAVGGRWRGAATGDSRKRRRIGLRQDADAASLRRRQRRPSRTNLVRSSSSTTVLGTVVPSAVGGLLSHSSSLSGCRAAFCHRCRREKAALRPPSAITIRTIAIAASTSRNLKIMPPLLMLASTQYTY